ncbi:unnamed protein product [Rhizophagus irregularis]|nr:unnamed protein product [Rhizophagus irregularis]
MTNEARKEKFANDRKEFAGFNFDKELVLYKSKTPDQIHKDIFWPSFGQQPEPFNGNVNIILLLVTKNTFGFDNF